jgi:uncharacterized membrane protein YozB (DUF420 family)
MDWLREPGFFGTHATMGADLSQLMATVFTTLFVIGWFKARRGRANTHHWLMLCGMLAMVGFFTAYYLFRQLGVLAVEGKEGFGGSQDLYDHVFIPILVVHIILVIIGLVMAIYMIILGFRAQMFVGERRQLNERPLLTTWKRIGAIIGSTTVLALLLFALRAATAGFSMRKFEVYAGLIILVAFVLGIETTIQRLWPSGAQRHRALGLFTMIIYCILFITGTTTYTMLYILYPGKIG